MSIFSGSPGFESSSTRTRVADMSKSLKQARKAAEVVKFRFDNLHYFQLYTLSWFFFR